MERPQKKAYQRGFRPVVRNHRTTEIRITGWQGRGIKKQIEYAILTAEISKATFGLTPSQYKKIKGLKKENLRDHMNDLELIFSMLGEASTTEIVRTKDTQGFKENKEAAKEGGKIAGNARKELEAKTKKKIVSKENYLPEAKKRLGRKSPKKGLN